MANSISVAVAESETMRVGRWSRVSPPTVTGKPAIADEAVGWAAEPPAEPVPPQPARARPSATSTIMGEALLIGYLLSVEAGASPTGGEGSCCARPVCEAPFLEGAYSRRAAGRRPGSSPATPG